MESTEGTAGGGAAFERFEAFLEEFHAGRGSFEGLCREHPEHAARFERWWTQLVQAGEVRESDSIAEQPAPEAESSFGPFEVERELGRGAQGTVYLANDTRHGRRIALKVLPKFRGSGRDRVRRFAREAELASRLDHAGLCEVFESGELAGSAYLAMRYVEGETLAAHIARARREREDGNPVCAATGWLVEAPADPYAAVHEVLGLFCRIADALHVAHQERLIHRDVKPGNVVVEPSGQPVLLDFGLARDDDSDVLTLTGDLIGTPAYMSPEQVTARIELDARTDVYSLGAMLYECLTLHRPFDAPTRSELYQKILAAEPPDPRTYNEAISRDLAVVLSTALEKDRDRRYRTAAHLAADLRRVQAREPVEAKPLGRIGRVRRWARRNPVVAASATVVFLALSTGLGVSLYFQAETAQARSAFHRLTNRARIVHAIEAAHALRPPWPEKVPAMAEWLRVHAEPLERDLPAMEAALAEIRAGALPYTAADRAADASRQPRQADVERLQSEAKLVRENVHRARTAKFRKVLEGLAAELESEAAEILDGRETVRSYRFAAVEDQVVHDTLASVLTEARRFLRPDGLVARTREHLAWARTVGQRTVEAVAAQWQKAREEVAADARFGAFVLEPQLGLVPLGKDPRTSLQEFGHPRSGAVPERDPETQQLRCDGTTGLVFVLLPGGDFVMGGGRNRRRYRVTLDAFFVSKFEVSRGQWRRLGGPANAASVGMRMGDATGDEYPMDAVSHLECEELLDEFGLALPTEAQWEYAARGGRRSNWWWGNLQPIGNPPENLLDATMEEMVGRKGRASLYEDGFVAAAPVNALRANPYGLHHVHGNVHEWCREYYNPVPLELFTVQKGDGLHLVPSAPERVVRGGSFQTPPVQSYVTARGGQLGSARFGRVGLRPVRMVR